MKMSESRWRVYESIRRFIAERGYSPSHKEICEAVYITQLSGYANELYDNRLRHWHRVEHRALAEAGRIRTEVLWINPVAQHSRGN